METFRKFAHESGDGIQVCHCPFCGSGQVIGRSDGNAECSFCNSAFMVRVQPMYSAFPQSINGMPVQIPGMPAPDPMGMGGGMPPGEDGEVPPGAEGEEEDGNPFADDSGGEGEEEPGSGPPSQSDQTGTSKGDSDGPAKKESSFHTGGRWVDRAQYLAHLASVISRP